MTYHPPPTMTTAAPHPRSLAPPVSPEPTNGALFRQLLVLALPVLAENILHMFVGLNDTYLANKLKVVADRAPAGAAVGTITYFLWFIGLLVSSVGAGSTAIIARAKGARHRSLANSVTGQSMSASILIGIGAGVLMYVFAGKIIGVTGLLGSAPAFALPYLKMLSWSLPFSMAMFIANSCQRGNGDTLTPAIVMIIVDLVNAFFSWGLCRGWFGMPELGFNGIALGTIIAYVVGGAIQFGVLSGGRTIVIRQSLRNGLVSRRGFSFGIASGLRLHWHRMWPHWATIKRLLRIGLPAGIEGVLMWVANFGVVRIINTLDSTNAMPNAHMNAIRVESVSFMTGFAFSTAAATMVGQSLGMNDPRRATRSAYVAYAVGGGLMTLCGLIFILFGRYPASWLAPDAHIAELTTRCLFITGFIQSGFAAYMIFSGALRGAGDTMAVMIFSLISVIGIRFFGAEIVGGWLHMSLAAIWVVLAGELFFRGVLAYGRFLQGGWKHVKL